MFHRFSIFFILIPFLCSAGVERWKVNDLGTIAKFEYVQALDLNDAGQMLLECYDGAKKVQALSSVEAGLNLLPQLPPKRGTSDTDIYWLKCNRCSVVGIRSLFINRMFVPELVTWNPINGVRKYSFNSTLVSQHMWASGAPGDLIKIASCGNSDRIALTCDDKIFTLENDKLTDLSPRLVDALSRQGENFYHVKWKAFSVNNHGAIFGKFECFDKHPYKDKELFKGTKLFYWNDEVLKVQGIPENVNFGDNFCSGYLNNQNQISFKWVSSNKIESWLWDTESSEIQLQECSFFSDGEKLRCYILAVLDDGTLVWQWGNEGLIIQQDDNFSLLVFQDIPINPDVFECDGYSSLALSYPNFYYPIINNQMQVHLRGTFYKESHPFLLTPISN